MPSLTDAPQGQAELRCHRPAVDTLRVERAGPWRLQDDFPPLTEVERALEAPPREALLPRAVRSSWDTK